jgi:hypothetical protein
VGAAKAIYSKPGSAPAGLFHGPHRASRGSPGLVIAEISALVIREAIGRFIRRAGGFAMTFSRALPIALAVAVLPVCPAAAQFGGMPGLPGGMSPGMPGSPFGAPQQPPPACQELLSFREEAGRHGQALQEASKKKVGPEQLCKLFKLFLAAEGKMIKGLEERQAMCGVPAEAIKQVKAGHSHASTMGKQVCDAAAAGPRPAGPSLSEVLGSTPVVPDPSSGTKRGAGTFDTLEGSPLMR